VVMGEGGLVFFSFVFVQYMRRYRNLDLFTQGGIGLGGGGSLGVLKRAGLNKHWAADFLGVLTSAALI